METRNKQWQETVLPICFKLKLYSEFGRGVQYNPEGAIALATLLSDMAQKLDLSKDALEDIVTLEGNNV